MVKKIDEIAGHFTHRFHIVKNQKNELKNLTRHKKNNHECNVFGVPSGNHQSIAVLLQLKITMIHLCI